MTAVLAVGSPDDDPLRISNALVDAAVRCG